MHRPCTSTSSLPLARGMAAASGPRSSKERQPVPAQPHGERQRVPGGGEIVPQHTVQSGQQRLASAGASRARQTSARAARGGASRPWPGGQDGRTRRPGACARRRCAAAAARLHHLAMLSCIVKKKRSKKVKMKKEKVPAEEATTKKKGGDKKSAADTGKKAAVLYPASHVCDPARCFKCATPPRRACPAHSRRALGVPAIHAGRARPRQSRVAKLRREGGRLSIEKNAKGGQFGVCTFPDNLQCEEWAMLRGQCRTGGIKITGYATPAARYCAITGGTYAVTAASNTAVERGTCTFATAKSAPPRVLPRTCPRQMATATSRSRRASPARTASRSMRRSSTAFEQRRLVLSDGRNLTLPQTMSGSGARYADKDGASCSGTRATRLPRRERQDDLSKVVPTRG